MESFLLKLSNDCQNIRLQHFGIKSLFKCIIYAFGVKSTSLNKSYIQLYYCRPIAHNKLAYFRFIFNSSKFPVWSLSVQSLWDNKRFWSRLNSIRIIYQRFEYRPTNNRRLNERYWKIWNIQSKIQSLIPKLSYSFIEFWLWHLDRWSLFVSCYLFNFIEYHSWNLTYFDIPSLELLRTNNLSSDRYLDKSSNDLWSCRHRIMGFYRRCNWGRSDNRRNYSLWFRKFRKPNHISSD